MELLEKVTKVKKLALVDLFVGVLKVVKCLWPDETQSLVLQMRCLKTRYAVLNLV